MNHGAWVCSSTGRAAVSKTAVAGSSPVTPATDVARVAVVQPSVADVVGGRSLTPPAVVFYGHGIQRSRYR